MKTILFAVCMILAASTHAAVSSVFVWDAPPGGDPAMIQTAMSAKAIHEKLGATVFVGVDQEGRMHYGVSFETAAERGAFFDKIQTNEEFSALMAEASQRDKAATMQEVFNMTVALGSGGAGGNVIMVFQYQPNPGRTEDVIAKMAEAKVIQEKLGAAVSVNIDEEGWAHYVLNFANWEAQGKFADSLADNEAWNAFQQSLADDPLAELKNVFRVTALTN
ncbi:MAG: hypothetical protein OES38_10765 [Gammaproteobacteria bacterium]|nr:hypothetical protein [Gammaproteobacteria bacterium]